MSKLDGNTGLPHRQAKVGLIIAYSRYVKMPFFFKQTVFDSGVDGLLFRCKGEVLQFVGPDV